MRPSPIAGLIRFLPCLCEAARIYCSGNNTFVFTNKTHSSGPPGNYGEMLFFVEVHELLIRSLSLAGELFFLIPKIDKGTSFFPTKFKSMLLKKWKFPY